MIALLDEPPDHAEVATDWLIAKVKSLESALRASDRADDDRMDQLEKRIRELEAGSVSEIQDEFRFRRRLAEGN